MIQRAVVLGLLMQPAEAAPPFAAPPAAAAPSDELIGQTADEVARLLEDGEHERAMQRLDDVDPDAQYPPLVYMRGVVEEDRGNCPAAIAHYEHYMEMGVLDVDASAAARRRDRCERLMEAARAHTPPPPTVPPEDAPPPKRSGDPAPRYADPWAISLTALGVVGVGIGAGLFGQGRVEERAAKDAFDLLTYRDRGGRAESLQRTGVTLMAIGGGIVAIGVARFVWISVARKRVAERAFTPLQFRF